jgi:hypothetical protein
MTELLGNLIAQLRLLPSIAQDAIASHLLTEIQDEQRWSKSFTETSGRQWKMMADMVRQEIASKEVISLDMMFPLKP